MLILTITINILFACRPRSFSLKTGISSTIHHIEVGMVLLEKNKLKKAEKEFLLALESNPKLVKAYIGLALIAAKQGKEKKAWEKLEKAETFVKNNEEKAEVLIGKIRLIYLLFTKKSLSIAEEAFKQIMQLKPAHPLATYYMACLYEKAFLFDKAKILFERVLKTENPFVLQAYNEIEKIKKIEKAQPKSNIGREIGLKDTLTKADIAALLVHELHLPQILEVTSKSQIIVRDIGKERFVKEIEAIVPLKIKELSATIDGYFSPQQKITRASFCEILQDILIRLTGNKYLSFRFKKVRSPYKDLKPKASYYNACILALVKGFITPYDRPNRLFGPMKPLSGADALIALKRLCEELKII